MEKIKIIGTGLTGLVGSRVVELLNDKYDFIDFSLNTGIDITKAELLKKLFQRYRDSSVVLHMAAFTDLNAAWEQKGVKDGPCYRINVIGTKNISHLCQKYGQYLIHISTDFVFDGKNPPIGGYTEKDKPQPIEGDWYGETKYLAEKEVISSGARYTILRIAFPYKVKPSTNEASKISPQTGHKEYKLDLVRKMISNLKANKPLTLFSDQTITPTFIDDIARVIDTIIDKKPKNDVFHCVGSEAITPYQIGQIVARKFHLPVELVEPLSLDDYHHEHPNRRPYPKNSVLSVQKLVNLLGITPLTFTQGVAKYENIKN
jgi:dTDP-4-dehydrorhamnose reductase